MIFEAATCDIFTFFIIAKHSIHEQFHLHAIIALQTYSHINRDSDKTIQNKLHEKCGNIKKKNLYCFK